MTDDLRKAIEFGPEDAWHRPAPEKDPKPGVQPGKKYGIVVRGGKVTYQRPIDQKARHGAVHTAGHDGIKVKGPTGIVKVRHEHVLSHEPPPVVPSGEDILAPSTMGEPPPVGVSPTIASDPSFYPPTEKSVPDGPAAPQNPPKPKPHPLARIAGIGKAKEEDEADSPTLAAYLRGDAPRQSVVIEQIARSLVSDQAAWEELTAIHDVPIASNPDHREAIARAWTQEQYHRWALGTNDPALQHAAIATFRMRKAALLPQEGEGDPSEANLLRRFLRAQYRATQKLLRDLRVKNLVLYHGATWTDIPPELAKIKVGKSKVVQGMTLAPLSVMSCQREPAEVFAKRARGPSFIVCIPVAADSVLATAWTGMADHRNQEVVVLGDSFGDIEVERVQ